MKITIEPVDIRSDLYFNSSISEMDWRFHWTVEQYGWCDEGLAPTERRALKMAKKAGSRIEELKHVTLKRCED